MTLEECAATYDVSIYFDPDDNLWHWFLSSGYCQGSSNKGYEDPNQCRDELIEYL